MYRKNKQDKKSILLKQDRKLFHTNDLAILWNITKPNTLYTTIKRYKKKGILIPIKKGFYSLLPLQKIDPVKLGIAYLHCFAYLSCETVLAQHGVIFQAIPHITLISKTSKRFKIANNSYLVRQMKPDYLYNETGIIEKEGYKLASPERAAADLLYYNPRYHLDNKNLLNWKKVTQIQKEVGFR